mgnify:FL=1
MEKWFVINKGADFEKLGKEFSIAHKRNAYSSSKSV